MATTNISGFGAIVDIVASSTFPTGFPLTQFADDADPITFQAVRIADTSMGLNGDLLRWSKAAPLPVTINVVPGSVDDINLQILANANRVAQGKNSVNDEITMTIVYPDGQLFIFSGGAVTDGEFGRGISTAGRQKTKSYSFSFSNVT